MVRVQDLMELLSRITALFLMVFLSPFFFIIGISSWAIQGLPILYKQSRVGYDYHIFDLYKFRSMRGNDGKMTITAYNDNRITLWGRVLRASKLDELPQLWNIVIGEMRFIGPRPEVIEHFNKDDFSFLKIVKPGLTDFSSILLRNETKILERRGGVKKYPELLKFKLQLGHLYANQKSFSLDLKLLLLTIVSLFLPRMAISAVKKYFITKQMPEMVNILEKWIPSKSELNQSAGNL